MNEIRIRFSRGEEVKYISHLDLMRTFERALRRAELPVYYSQGFNPHPHLVFGLPLSVGIASDAEYADIAFEKDVEPEAVKKMLNISLPKGLKVIDACKKNQKENIMAIIAAASYNIDIFFSESGICREYDNIEAYIDSKLNEFLELNEINAEKNVKGVIKNIDIKPLIIRFNLKKVEQNSKKSYANIYDAASFSVLARAGSKANLKPDVLADAFCKFAGINPAYYSIYRTGLFVECEGKLIDPIHACI